MSANTYLPNTTYTPSALEITAITQAKPMAVTTVAEENQANTYREGQLVKFTIPFAFGMQQANNLIAKILSVSGTILYMDVDSTRFDPFAVPSPATGVASLASCGARNLEYSNSTNQVPFQVLNNEGN